MNNLKNDFQLSGIWYYPWSIFVLLTSVAHPWSLIGMFLKRKSAGWRQIRLRQGGLKFNVRGPMDVWSVKETLLDRFYERNGMGIEAGWVIVDIGAGIGDFSLRAATAHPTNRVIAFEPFEESYRLLSRNLAENGASNVETHAMAIGRRSGVAYLDLSGNEPLQIQSGEARDEAGWMQVESLSLSDAFVRCAIETCDLLKLDCEGAEYEILLNAPDHIWQRVHRIVMEYHDNVGTYNHERLVDFLTQKGYRVLVQRNYVHASLGYLYACRSELR